MSIHRLAPEPPAELMENNVQSALKSWAWSVVCDAPVSFPTDLVPDPETLLRYTDHHGVSALIYARLGRTGLHQQLPPEFARALDESARIRSGCELLLREEIVGVCESLQSAGLDPILLKGAALAYSLYPEPSQRGRSDTDILVASEGRQEAEGVLRGLGYEGEAGNNGFWSTSERTFTRTLAQGLEHSVDLHWRINNSPVFWHRELSHSRLLERTQPIPKLGKDARRPAWPDALVHACIHRTSHLYAPIYSNGRAILAGNRMIWLVDLRMLAAELTVQEWAVFEEITEEMAASAICRAALDAANVDLADTPLPREWGADPSDQRQIGLVFLRDPIRSLMGAELRALPNHYVRLKWLVERLLPPAEFLQTRYPDYAHWPPVALRLLRLLHGANKLGRVVRHH